MADQIIAVGLGEFMVTRDQSAVLTCYGLGSCIGLIAYDPAARVGGMVHIVLPDSSMAKQQDNAAKFADTAVPLLIDEVCSLGAKVSRLQIKMAGGAQMFKAGGLAPMLDIGLKNAAAVKATLASMDLSVCGEDIGGNFGRTLQLKMAEGKVWVKAFGRGEHEL